MTERVLIHLLFVSLLLPLAREASAQDVDPERIAAVKAGMVVNFVRYTTWPEGTFADADSPIVLTVVGETEIDRALAAAAEGVVINGRRIEIRRVTYPPPAEGRTTPEEAEVEAFDEALRASQAVYFGSSEAGRVGGLLEAVKDSPVLTISATEEFAEKGGMLGLAIRDRRVAFDANEEVIKGSDLQVSSQVLKLARIVKTAPRRGAEETP